MNLPIFVVNTPSKKHGEEFEYPAYCLFVAPSVDPFQLAFSLKNETPIVVVRPNCLQDC